MSERIQRIDTELRNWRIIFNLRTNTNIYFQVEKALNNFKLRLKQRPMKLRIAFLFKNKEEIGKPFAVNRKKLLLEWRNYITELEISVLDEDYLIITHFPKLTQLTLSDADIFTNIFTMNYNEDLVDKRSEIFSAIIDNHSTALIDLEIITKSKIRLEAIVINLVRLKLASDMVENFSIRLK